MMNNNQKQLSICVIFLITSISYAQFNNFNDYLFFATKNNLKSVSEFAIINGYKDFDKQFENFKKDFEKDYTKEEEEFRKFQLFKSLKYIDSHNEMYNNGEVLHELGINHLSDWSSEELKEIHISVPLPSNQTENHETDINYSNDLPKSFDWRSKNKVTPVKNQKNCGSCWAFACVATIESQHAIKHNESISLSEQQLVDCSNGKNGCNYGFMNVVYDYVRNTGLEFENDYPYHAKQSLCENSNKSSLYKISGYKQLGFPASDLDIMNAIYNYGPTAVTIDSDGQDFHLYKRGIITTGGHSFNHYVTAIGWGEENGTEYWIVKNSWGTNWGEHGFGRMVRGHNIRNFNLFVFYPIL